MPKQPITLAQLHQELIGCRACPRLVAWREEVARTKRRAYQDEAYWGKPVPGFGAAQARLLLVGLAPGAHGANRTGRPFTGDGSGTFLFPALHRAGFANQPIATHRDDDLRLHDCYITGVVRCVPPQNRPTAEELATCRPYFLQELLLLDRVQVIITLGQIAFEHTLRALRELGADLPRLAFGHNRHYDLAAYNPCPTGTGAPAFLGRQLPHLLASYHPSRQNTQTGRLTAEMMDDVFRRARSLFSEEDTSPEPEPDAGQA